MVRTIPDEWIGYPYLSDPADRHGIAALVGRSPASALEGFPEDVEPLVDALSRTGEMQRLRNMTIRTLSSARRRPILGTGSPRARI